MVKGIKEVVGERVLGKRVVEMVIGRGNDGEMDEGVGLWG